MVFTLALSVPLRKLFVCLIGFDWYFLLMCWSRPLRILISSPLAASLAATIERLQLAALLDNLMIHLTSLLDYTFIFDGQSPLAVFLPMGNDISDFDLIRSDHHLIRSDQIMGGATIPTSRHPSKSARFVD